MVREYIGARYVIKIYENSLDSSSAEWEANVTYEPLTMVTYNNSSYISKKEVPANIGDPASNPIYWVVSGAYNGQIAQLQQDIVDLNNALTDVKHLATTPFNKPLNIVCVSDIHFSPQIFYNIPAQMRVEKLIDSLLEEHAKHPIDCLCILGDLTTDNVAPLTNGKEYLEVFYREYLNRLPFPVFSIAGNHDGYTTNDWQRITGTKREYITTWNDFVFVFLDSYDISNDTGLNNPGGAYHGNNASIVQKAIDTYPDKKIILFSHYFDYANDSAAFHSIVEDDHVLFLVQGHIHEYQLSTYGTKKLFTLGNFSADISNGVILDPYDPSDPFAQWSFTRFYADANGIVCQLIKPSNTYFTSADFATSVNFAGDVIDFGYITDYTNYVDSADYYVDLESFFLKQKMPQNDYYTLDLTTLIPWGSDLNDLKKIGVYNTGNTSWTNSLTNRPEDGLGGVKVIVERLTAYNSEGASTEVITQRLLSNLPGSSEFRRTYYANSNSWSGWQKILTTTNISEATIESYKLDTSGSCLISATNSNGDIRRLMINATTGALEYYEKPSGGSWTLKATLVAGS